MQQFGTTDILIKNSTGNVQFIQIKKNYNILFHQENIPGSYSNTFYKKNFKSKY